MDVDDLQRVCYINTTGCAGMSPQPDHLKGPIGYKEQAYAATLNRIVKRGALAEHCLIATCFERTCSAQE